ncbi:hypothetical protein LCGC14_2025330 [marine sediment metagenome]|uniref:Uncharacterized protein n=1 Tax=marine sediment metagenome TaxID=412755 RepID=A0A0F9EW94_9ZZZZ
MLGSDPGHRLRSGSNVLSHGMRGITMTARQRYPETEGFQIDTRIIGLKTKPNTRVKMKYNMTGSVCQTKKG